MRIIVSALGFMLLAISLGCDRVDTEYSTTLEESAKVVNVVFTPIRHTTKNEFNAVYNPFQGEFQMVPVCKSVEIPERFSTVFECSHGGFIVTRPNIYHRFVNRLKESPRGVEVLVTYREVYRCTYETDRYPPAEPKERVLIDLDFLDAKVKE